MSLLCRGKCQRRAGTAQGQEGSPCPKSHLTSTFSPYAAARTESPVGTAARSVLRAPEPSASPGPPCGSSRDVPAQRFKCHLVALGAPWGQTGVPSSLPASLALPTAPARRCPAALPSSPQRHPTAPFPHPVYPPPPISTFLLFPVVPHPPFPVHPAFPPRRIWAVAASPGAVTASTGLHRQALQCH